VNNTVNITSSGGLISIQTHKIGQKVIITIRDTGIIIDIDKAKALFSESNIGSTAVKKEAVPGILIQKDFAQCMEMENWMAVATEKDSTFYFSLQN
jgi:signal transduction histidine kinase